MLTNFGIIIAAIVLAWSQGGCQEQGFKGSGGKDSNRNGAEQGAGPTNLNPDPYGPGANNNGLPNNNGDPNNPGNGDPNNPGTIGNNNGGQFLPQVCSLQSNTIRFVSNGQCQEGAAAYAADDSDSVHLACCPVPIRDMLVGAATLSDNTCPTGSVAVGAQGTRLWCRALNPQYAQATPPKPTCYYGSGAAGGSGSQACSAPPATIQAMTTRFGTDSCLPNPFGGLIVGRRGKNCSDVIFVNIIDPRTGQPMQMFQ
jgi:hypothetical protein